MVGRPLAHLGYGYCRSRHLHQRKRPFLHPRATGCRDDDKGDGLGNRGTGTGYDPVADADAHRPAEEPEIQATNDRTHTADRSDRQDQGFPMAGARLCFLQPISVLSYVAKAKRIDRRFRRIQGLKNTPVEQHAKPVCSAQPEVMAALGTDLKVFFQVAVKNELAAARTFAPEIIGNFPLAAHELTKLGADNFGEPAQLTLPML